ncbi:MAG TPA: DUF1175 family protein, partial [Deinococcales bacterium]|nr:DUF1175 family protein [Deinococcales bacterium]
MPRSVAGRRWRVLAACLLVTAAARAAGAGDLDGDGYPDALELSGSDRTAFADWFAAVAESQFYAMSDRWAPEDRDCAGLLRFAYRGALERHDDAWRSQFRYLPRVSHGAVAAYGFPAPLVSRSLFRVAPGPYRQDDVAEGRMVGRTGARFLALHSAVHLGRDWRAARRGDLLFFLRPGKASYHSMVFLGGGRVVYHTGAAPQDGDEAHLAAV